jgi:hypothetical protein
MEVLPRNYWRRTSWVFLGILIGVTGLLWLRVLYYDGARLGPNMAPQIAFIFEPFIVTTLAVIAAFFEAGFSKYWFIVPKRRANVLLGISYASIVIALIPPASILFAVTNPLVVRWLMRRWNRRGSSAV